MALDAAGLAKGRLPGFDRAAGGHRGQRRQQLVHAPLLDELVLRLEEGDPLPHQFDGLLVDAVSDQWRHLPAPAARQPVDQHRAIGIARRHQHGVGDAKGVVLRAGCRPASCRRAAVAEASSICELPPPAATWQTAQLTCR